MRCLPLLDADAFNCLRSLGLLTRLREKQEFRVLMTGYVRDHDLCSLQADLAELSSQQKLEVFSLRASDPEFRRLRRDGVDRGEAEAIAWALSQPKSARPVFISNDRRARERALKERVPAGDLLDLLVEYVRRGLLAEPDVQAVADIWDDRHQERCRPRDWDGYSATWSRRVASPPRWEDDPPVEDS